MFSLHSPQKKPKKKTKEKTPRQIQEKEKEPKRNGGEKRRENEEEKIHKMKHTKGEKRKEKRKKKKDKFKRRNKTPKCQNQKREERTFIAICLCFVVVHLDETYWFVHVEHSGLQWNTIKNSLDGMRTTCLLSDQLMMMMMKSCIAHISTS